MTQLVIMAAYLGLLPALAWFAGRHFRGTASDYFLADRSIGPFMLLMSIFGTTMTAFALVGSTGESFRAGIGVYGMMASWSGLVHAGVFFFVGIRLWAIGKRYGFVTQVQYFRDRFQSNALGWLLFPILVALVIPYLMTGLLGAGAVITSLTEGALPEVFASTRGGVPPWLGGLVISLIVLLYVFVGGLRAAVWANAFQTCIFLVACIIAFGVIAQALGGLEAAGERVLATHPEKMIRGEAVPPLYFMTYFFIPLSAGMFPHIFQHWLTARSAKTFRLTLVAHPILILLVWLPCVLIGVWATSALLPDGSAVVPAGAPPNTELATMVRKLTGPLLGGLLGAGILAAVMSSLDSQFFCLGTMFTNDIVVHSFGEDRFDDRTKVLLGRGFIVVIVAAVYLFSLAEPRHVFTLGVWCFSGFAGLFPLVVAALYWRRTTKAGAMASVAAAGVIWFLLFREAGYGAERAYLFLDMLPAATIFAGAAAALVGVSLVTEPPPAATLRRYFAAANGDSPA